MWNSGLNINQSQRGTSSAWGAVAGRQQQQQQQQPGQVPHRQNEPLPEPKLQKDGSPASNGGPVPGLPSIATPKAGGAIRGIGEMSSVDPSSGSVTASIPVHISKARSEFEPKISLEYQSSAGNGPFGFGWQIPTNAITRQTDRGLPLYRDAADSDTFILNGFGELTPLLALQPDGTWKEPRSHQKPRVLDSISYLVRQFVPRNGPPSVRIERWTNEIHGDSFWRVITGDNLTTVYGDSAESRIYDPDQRNSEHPPRIFSWLAAKAFDDRGNAMIYGYKAEDATSLNLRHLYEATSSRSRTAHRYLKRIKYGNTISHLRDPRLAETKWLFELVLDYGDHDPENPKTKPQKDWPCRRDPFSTFRAGFEIRQYRLCQRILMFHHFPEEANVGDDCLVASTDLTYRDPEIPQDDGRIGQPRGSFLASTTSRCYKRSQTGYEWRAFPSIDFKYSLPVIDDMVTTLDPVSLQNIPVGLASSDIHFVDLYGEGIPGILTKSESSWIYKPNLGEGRFGSAHVVGPIPSTALLSQLIDLNGDGNLDWVSFAPPSAGFSKIKFDGSWENFQTFQSAPNLDWQDPNLCFLDLTGDGLPDVVLVRGEVLIWYQSCGEEGFTGENRRFAGLDASKDPRLIFADPTQSIFTADMTGDGLVDLVRITKGKISYWPNKGYGHFGSRISMSDSPKFDGCDIFHRDRIRLADIDGSGTADLIYFDDKGANVYFNECGNSWETGPLITSFPSCDNSSGIHTVDLLGKGTLCLVWSSPLPRDSGLQLRYVNLMEKGKPHLLTGLINNLGSETRYHYAASTKFYLKDKREGNPWISPIPFPVHVVESVETEDRVSKNLFTTRYEYHHGYYDGKEREFCGFGRVEQHDTSDLEILSDGATNFYQASQIPPLTTKTWFHTGQSFFNEDYSDRVRREYYREPGLTEMQQTALFLPASILPQKIILPDHRLIVHDLSAKEALQAPRAMRGAVLRQELFSNDAPFHSLRDYEVHQHPYAVTEHRYRVNMTQPRGKREKYFPVFFSTLVETVTYHYERRLYKIGSKRLTDPRVAHELILSNTYYGQPLQTVAVSYGRRHRLEEDDQFLDDLESQREISIVVTENKYTKAVSSETAFRILQPSETRMFQIHNTQVGSGDPLTTNLVPLATANDWWMKASDGRHDLANEDVDAGNLIDDFPHRRVLSHSRKYYRSDDLSKVLDLGNLESRAISYHTLSLASTPSTYQKAFITTNKATTSELSTILADVCKFTHSEGDANWWTSSGQFFFSPNASDNPTDELEYAEKHFFTARRYQDNFHSLSFRTETSVEYDDYDLLIIETKDQLGSLVTVGERRLDNTLDPLIRQRGMDYRILQPRVVMDPNRNRTKFVYDIRGMITATAAMGKPEEHIGDDIAGFNSDITDDSTGPIFENPVSNAQDLLGSATTRVVYDLFAYVKSATSDKPKPCCTLAISRVTHVSAMAGAGPSDSLITLSYSDGFGRAIQGKCRASPGPVPARDATGNIVVDSNGDQILTDFDVNPRWICDGWTVFDNKGNPVRHFEPFYTDTHSFKSDTAAGVSTITFFDPLGRSIGVVNPNHSWSKTVFDPWQYTSWEVSDTVSIPDPTEDVDLGFFFCRLPAKDYVPSWSSQRLDDSLGPDEQRAAVKSKVYGGTPNTLYFDSMGRTVLGVSRIKAKYSDRPAQEDPVSDQQSFRIKYDVQGRQLDIFDSLKRRCAHTEYDMAGTTIYQHTMEAGQRWTINDSTGATVYRWNDRGYRTILTYDELRRPRTELLRHNFGPNMTVCTHEYGEAHMTRPESMNLRGKLVTVCDQAGKVVTDKYDFKGLLFKTTRKFAVDYKEQLDWSALVPMEDATYKSQTTYDALGRLIHSTLWDDTTVSLSYDLGGNLSGIASAAQGTGPVKALVKRIDYNARGQKTLIEYDNGTIKHLKYNRYTFQLRDVIVIGRQRNEIQNTHYVFDVAGNVVHIKDSAQPTHFFRNQVVSPDNEYTYDSIGRLIEATGREHVGQIDDTPGPRSTPNPFRDFQSRTVSPNLNGTMGRYNERYRYSSVNNIISMQHEGSPQSPGWTQTYEYEQLMKNNRVTSTSVGSETEAYGYTGEAGLHGCMTSMPHLSVLEWNFADQIHTTAKTVVNNGGTPSKTWYRYEGKGSRVRKVTDSQAVQGQEPKRTRERLYLGASEIYREYESDGITVSLERATLYLKDESDPIARIDVRTKGTQPQVPQTIYRYQLTNHLKSIGMELDENGDLASYEEYTPFGTTSYYAVENELEVPKFRRWNNKERDEESGFYYFGARYYAPWLARWTSADPVGLVDGLNLFAYVSNNPIMRTDPSGTTSKEVEVFLDELILYADKILNRASVGKNVQKDHAIAQEAIKRMLGPIFQQLYDKTKDLTVAVQTGKGEWHTIKSTLERVIRVKVTSGEIKTVNELVMETVNVLIKANVASGMGSALTRAQNMAILDQLGNLFNQMTLEEAGKMFKMMEAGDTAGMQNMVKDLLGKTVDVAKSQALAEAENQLARGAQALKSAAESPVVKTAVEKGEKALETVGTGVKTLAQEGGAAATKGGGGKLFMRGAGVALSLLFLMTAKNDNERLDAKIGLVGTLLLEMPQPVARAAGGGIVAGQIIDKTLSVSYYSALAGMWAFGRMKQHGFSEDTSFITGGVVTVLATPSAIGYALAAKIDKAIH